MQFNIKKLVKISMVAALYVVTTIAISPIAYGPVQFRISELLNLLAFIDPIFIPGLALGCAIANAFGTLGIVDVIAGSLATLLSAFMIYKSRNIFKQNILNLFIASIWPVVINGLVVGAELFYLCNLPFVLSALQVAAGELVVVMIVGVPLFAGLIKNKHLLEILKD
jgi:uncharacterized membrane protein